MSESIETLMKRYPVCRGYDIERLLERLKNQEEVQVYTAIKNSVSENRDWLVKRISEIKEIMPLSEIDTTKDISTFGLSSLEAMSLSGEIEERIGSRVSPTILYDYPSIDALSQYLFTLGDNKPLDEIEEILIEKEANECTANNTSQEVIEKCLAELVTKGISISVIQGKVCVRGIINSSLLEEVQVKINPYYNALVKYIGEKTFQPLSRSQERYRILTILQDGKAAYNDAIQIKLEGTLDVNALKKALLELINTHDLLRASFNMFGHQCVQVIDPPFTTIDFPYIDIEGLPLRNKELENIIREESTNAINPMKDANFRYKLIKVSSNEHILLITVHHILFDGYSFNPFISQLFSFYEAIHNGASLPEGVTGQYVDYIIKEYNEYDNDEGKAFWAQKMSGAPPYTELPLDFERLDVNSYRGTSISTVISHRLVDKMAQIEEKLKVSRFVILVSALQATLKQWTKQNDLVIGTVVQNRDKPSYQKMLGDFTNFLPLRFQITDYMKLEDLILQTNQVVKESLAHKSFSFEKIVDMAPVKLPNINPVYNIHVNYLPPQPKVKIDDRLTLGIQNNRLLSESSMMDLRFEWNENTSGINMVCEYNTDLFKNETIEQLAMQFEQILVYILEHDNSLVNDLPEVAIKHTKKVVTKSVQGRIQPLAKSTAFDYTKQIETAFSFVLPELNGLIDKDINFFQMGGSSKKAIELMMYLQENGLKVGITDIFRYPSVTLLAQYLAQHTDSAKGSESQPKYQPAVEKPIIHTENRHVTIKVTKQQETPNFLAGQSYRISCLYQLWQKRRK
ncbi:phosphopantetheine binding protein [Ruminiclostridium sufflavum DSM 19573]|uniref:Phosphopantetheine binding protein n=1 Tax=Ruminiclostridium sufflavum DSM 19573 TaxID=1121337 RepID=A0A318Y1T4_9FIRM|nr:condensation domain-containing protein [Ruminiclostridium sufflavum]PYG84958.1 phosphopantetheine binding protein [Ruminiclostridium sufflavum DSM 19573]